MKEQDKYLGFFIIGLLIGTIITFGTIYVIDDIRARSIILRSENPESIQEIIDKCSNKSLFESSECVRKEVLTFYKYNESNIGKDLTFEEIIEQGGVCSSWADLYCSIGTELGFYTKRVSILMGEYNDKLLGHAFCVWGNTIDDEFGGYVVIDQTSITKKKLRMN